MEVQKVKELLKNPNAKRADLKAALADAYHLDLHALKAAKEMESRIFNQCKGYFSQQYQNHTQVPLMWSAKDAGALKDIMKKLNQLTEGKTPVVEAFQYLIINLPDWYKSHGFSLPVINGKFNELIAEIKTNRNGASKSNVSDDYKARVLKDLVS
ncbi:hypothetical protein [Persicobacter sp. CCB-QB2]|uniref:hypothetical protein n=1 Tax=Persicobacter sp. CCB-QB2 TaxID=1561025 RepID=UPI0006A99C07|nr:hypothetical protein [Persicobacter sp. CCB-QB2]